MEPRPATMTTFHQTIAASLFARQREDGSFALAPGGEGEPEPTAVAAFAPDGGFAERVGPVEGCATAARLMGIDGERVAYLREVGRFLGQSRLDLIAQRGEGLERSATRFAVTEPFRDFQLEA